jgi:DNA-binding transcriptional LysR family regulator
MDVYHKAFNEVFENENIKPNIIMVSSSVRDALTLISKNIGVAILSSKVASNCPDIALVPLKRPLIRDTQMLIRNEKDTCLSTKLFFDFIKNAYT